ncbi:MAG TPA: hypothetical protein VEU52_08415, partial [Candidatus Limnocylindrales bacterium]|nr:hypothetical protein [Candidatus Limnocylindrales bacterium]
ETAFAAFERGEYESVLAYSLPHANSGNSSAQCMVALLYQCGLGVRRDLSKAEEFLLKAAQQNDAVAWNNLGTLYAIGGDDLSAGPEKAQECYQRAKDLGFDCAEPYPPGKVKSRQ